MEDISVLICDDSALMRNLISRIIDGADGMKIVGKAMNGQFLIDKIPQLNPDVIILDIEMPVMNGIEFLKYRREHHIDIPVIILSSIAEKGAAVTMECLELGASDFITKPNGSVSVDISSVADNLIELISSYGGQYARRKGRSVQTSDFFSRVISERSFERKLRTTMGAEAANKLIDSERERRSSVVTRSPLSDRPSARPLFGQPAQKESAVVTPLREGGRIEAIAIGISTGGPNALRDMFRAIDPALHQPVLVVQHMPAGFTKEFASSLDKICPLSVKEAEDGEAMESGHVYIAPGDYHIVVEAGGFGRKKIRLSHEPQRNGHRPSADVLFESMAKVFQNRCLGVIMTGMGKDGAQELAEMRRQGAWTLGQDEKSSIVYGMPKVAFELGGVQRQVPLEQMAAEVSKLAREHR